MKAALRRGRQQVGSDGRDDLGRQIARLVEDAHNLLLLQSLPQAKLPLEEVLNRYGHGSRH